MSRKEERIKNRIIRQEVRTKIGTDAKILYNEKIAWENSSIFWLNKYVRLRNKIFIVCFSAVIIAMYIALIIVSLGIIL